MSDWPNCPCCDEDGLRLASYELENGQLHYKAVCDCCGVELHHEKFYGYNNVAKFLEDACAPTACENWSVEGGANAWECSVCHVRRVKTEGEPPYKHCPDCGAEVVTW